MPYLIAAVVFLGALSGLNLLLVLGVLKRVREQATMLTGAFVAGAGGTELLAPGAQVGDFATAAVDGQLLELRASGERIVAFVKPGCAPCVEQLPALVQRAREADGGRESAIAVVVGTAEEAAPLLPRLSAVATVVVEPLDGPLSQAFRVPGFPAYFVIDGDGTVRASALRPSQLPVTQRA